MCKYLYVPKSIRQYHDPIFGALIHSYININIYIYKDIGK